MKLITYWRIFVLIVLNVLWFSKVISFFTYSSIIGGLFIYIGIPWIFKIVKETFIK